MDSVTLHWGLWVIAYIVCWIVSLGKRNCLRGCVEGELDREFQGDTGLYGGETLLNRGDPGRALFRRGSAWNARPCLESSPLFGRREKVGVFLGPTHFLKFCWTHAQNEVSGKWPQREISREDLHLEERCKDGEKQQSHFGLVIILRSSSIGKVWLFNG